MSNFLVFHDNKLIAEIDKGKYSDFPVGSYFFIKRNSIWEQRTEHTIRFDIPSKDIPDELKALVRLYL